jgi:hypothetical protein
MAKKKAKTPAAKKDVDSQKVEAILVDCALAVGMGVAQRGSKTISQEAAQAWQRSFRGGILRALREGHSWKKARPNALTVATNMGIFAADNEPSSIITKATADKATVAAKSDPACPPPKPGSGRFCK